MVTLTDALYLIYLGVSVVSILVVLVERAGQGQFLSPENTTSARNKILSLLAECNGGFSNFYWLVRTPARFVKGKTKLRTILLQETNFLVFITGLILVDLALVYGPVVTYSVVSYAVLVLLVLMVTMAFLSTFAINRVLKEPSIRSPSNGLLLLYSCVKSTFLYSTLVLLFFLALVFRTFAFDVGANRAATYAALESSSFLFSVAVFVPSFAILLFVFHRFTDRLVFHFQDLFFLRYFADTGLTIEVALKGKNQTREPIRGVVGHIASRLILRRLDGFIESIDWRDVGRVAIAPSS